MTDDRRPAPSAASQPDPLDGLLESVRQMAETDAGRRAIEFALARQQTAPAPQPEPPSEAEARQPDSEALLNREFGRILGKVMQQHPKADVRLVNDILRAVASALAALPPSDPVE